jgi:peptide/nickel transport system ATP-binding protein
MSQPSTAPPGPDVDEPTPVLDLAHVSVAFRTGRRRATFLALDDVSLSIQPGRTMGLIGESGSGKSTLANAVLGLAPVQSGSVTLLGEDITPLTARRRRRLGRSMQAVFQDPNNSLNPFWTVGRSLAEPVRAQGTGTRADIAARAARLLEDVGLDASAATKLPRQFSGGQRQRISIARALMTSPQLVICDEAVSALDLSVQAQVLNLLTDLQDKYQLSYLFISHNMSVVRHVCHDITVLYRGQVMEAGPTSAVAHEPAHPYTRALLLAVPVADPAVQRQRSADAAVTDLPSDPAVSLGCPFANRCPAVVDLCRQERPPLRPTGDGRVVACHRYPEWRADLPVTSFGAPTGQTSAPRTSPLSIVTSAADAS